MVGVKAREQLYSIVEIWLKGTCGTIQRVILIKWDKDHSTRTARGNVKVLGIRNGVISTLQREVYISTLYMALIGDLDGLLIVRLSRGFGLIPCNT